MIDTEAAASAQPHSQAPSPRTLHQLVVADVIDETADARSFVLHVPPPLRERFRYRAGQFVTIEITATPDPLRRCYSLASCPHTESHPRFTVKRVPGGRVSNWLNEQVRPGDLLRVKPPEGRFVLRDTGAPLILFGAGSGITPIISLLKAALATTARSITLVDANRDRSSIIFAAELARLERTHRRRLRLVHRLDDVDGLLRPEDVAGYLPASGDADHYVCGPAPFMDTVASGLAAAGVPSARVHIERFTAPPAPTSAAPTPTTADEHRAPATLTIELAGHTHHMSCPPGRTILDACLDANLDPPYSCRDGVCGCCVAEVLAGEVDVTTDEGLTDDEKRRGLVLTCQARPRSPTCSLRYIEG